MAREAKSPLLERIAIFAMIGSALTGMAVAAMHAVHLLKKDLKDDHREKEREHERRSDAPSADRPSYKDTASMPDTGHDGNERRWTRREEQPNAIHANARHR